MNIGSLELLPVESVQYLMDGSAEVGHRPDGRGKKTPVDARLANQVEIGGFLVEDDSGDLFFLPRSVVKAMLKKR